MQFWQCDISNPAVTSKALDVCKEKFDGLLSNVDWLITVGKEGQKEGTWAGLSKEVEGAMRKQGSGCILHVVGDGSEQEAVSSMRCCVSIVDGIGSAKRPRTHVRFWKVRVYRPML